MSNKQRLAAHMLVLDGASVVERALRPLKGLIDEICFTDTGSTDGTPELIYQIASDLRIPCKSFIQNHHLYPHNYFTDSQRSFNLKFEGEFTGKPLLADWSLARNRSLQLCTSRYVLKLDADDEILLPSDLDKVLNYLDTRPDISILAAPYTTMLDASNAMRESMYTRIWRNNPNLRFQEKCHENLDHARSHDGSNWMMLQNGLFICDWRDSKCVRTPHRYFKTLLCEYERLSTLGYPKNRHVLFYLADEGAEVAPEFSLKVLDEIHLNNSYPFSPSKNDLAWLSAIKARCLSAMGRKEDALEHWANSASFGWASSAIHLGFLQHELGLDGWRATLTGGLHNNGAGHYWPFGSTYQDLAQARKMISGEGESNGR